MKRILAIALLFMVVPAVLFAAEPTTILLVRHAEKAKTEGSDPELTEQGRARAEALAAVLADSGVSVVYSTPFIRTRDTAAPTAKRLGLETTITEVGPDFAKKLAGRILADNRGQTVLVVGHSNTLGPTIEALGAGPAFELDESEYGDLFVCTIPDGGEPTMLRLKF